MKRYSGEDTERGAFWENNTMSKFFKFFVIFCYMDSYAIIQASGKQFWVEEKRFYDFNKLPLQPGDVFTLNNILLVNQSNSLAIGKPFLNDEFRIEATVLRHLSGRKTRVYKMRSKKKTRKTFGERSKLTRVYINSICQITSEASVCFM